MKQHIVFTLLTLINCGGGSGGDDGDGDDSSAETIQYTGKTTPAVITEESADQIVENLSAFIPGCAGSSQDSSEALVRLPLALVKGVKSAINRPPSMKTLSRMVFARIISANVVDYSVSGVCGGTMAVSGSHDNATTIGEVTFNNFCTSDLSSDDTTIGGSIAFTDEGQDGVSGPVREELTASSDQISVASGTDAASVAFSGFAYDVGVPGQPPRLLTPDIACLGALLLRDDNTGRVSKLEDLHVELYEDCYDPCIIGGMGPYDHVYVRVNSGRVYDPDAGYVNLATPTNQPLIMNSQDGALVSGGLVLTGANGETATLSMDAQEGAFSVTVGNTTVSGVAMDCSDVDVGFNLTGSTEVIGSQ